MYVSCLLVDVGTNPDRPRPGRVWLRNRYRVHQRLCMAFPSTSRREHDSDFLKPYDPDDFPEDRYLADRASGQVQGDGLRHVHAKRDENSGFLFRIDPQAGGRVSILVVSALKPAWDYAFHNAGHLLAAPPSGPRPFKLTIQPGSRFRFHLVANPTKKIETLSKEDRLAKAPKRHGKRVPVPADEASLRNWLDRRGAQAGFAVVELTLVQRGYVYVKNPAQADNGRRLRSVRYEGLLEVTGQEKFRGGLAAGIGPAKAFGFGLLSVAPVR